MSSPETRVQLQTTSQLSAPAASSGRIDVGGYVELEPILSLAVDAAVYTFDIDVEADRELVIYLEEAVAEALIRAYAPIAAIARQASRVAAGARAAQLDATARAAQVMAVRVAEVAAALHARGEASAVNVAQVASDAADLLAASVAPGDERAAAWATAQVAAAVRDAAAMKSREHAQAAAIVAEAAASAAAKVTDTADVQNVAVELKVFEAAAAVQAIALDACYQVAINAAATAAERIITKRSDY